MKVLAGLALVGALAIAGVWYAHGMHMGTLTKKLVETTVTDEFGDEEIERAWEKTFELGLDYGAPAAGGLVGLAGLLLFLDRRKKKATTS